MNTKDMKAQLATIKAKRTKSVAPDTTHIEEESSWIDGTAQFIGAVPSATFGFFDAISTSYKYHEAKRKGLL